MYENPLSITLNWDGFFYRNRVQSLDKQTSGNISRDRFSAKKHLQKTVVFFVILCNLRHVWSCAFCMVIFYETCIWNFCVLLAPRNKGQWRGKTRRGQNFGRLANQEHYRQQRDFSDRKDVYNQPQRRGAMPNRRPPSRGFLPTPSGSRKVINYFLYRYNVMWLNVI